MAGPCPLCSTVPTHAQIWERTTEVLGLRPCIGQIKAAVAQLENATDIIYISGTGSGKNHTFWIPMLFEINSITLLVTALNILGQQIADQLEIPL
jgi:hypothetical protein